MEKNLITAHHIPVLLNEVMDFLSICPFNIIVDATCGEGGHSIEIIKKIPNGRLICLDRDGNILKIAQTRLGEFKNASFYQMTFDKIGEALAAEQLSQGKKIKADGILADLGISMFHFREGGFSYMDDSSLDMRLDPDQEISADMIINHYREEKIADIIYLYGEERESRRIARAICRERPVKSARDLASIVMRSKKQKISKIHPATKTFQALRIFINKELEILESFIPHAVDNLSENGRLVIISYHSLEDRIVKNGFKQLALEGKGVVVTKKPVIPAVEEIRNNRASRSAKLRIFEKRGP